MPKHSFHFLNVKDGDCSVIEHGSGHVSVIDVCNARKPENKRDMSFAEYQYLEKSSQLLTEVTGARKNYGQKKIRKTLLIISLSLVFIRSSDLLSPIPIWITWMESKIFSM